MGWNEVVNAFHRFGVNQLWTRYPVIEHFISSFKNYLRFHIWAVWRMEGKKDGDDDFIVRFTQPNKVGFRCRVKLSDMFPESSTDRWVAILLKHDYTDMLNQKTEPVWITQTVFVNLNWPYKKFLCSNFLNSSRMKRNPVDVYLILFHNMLKRLLVTL